MSLNDPTGGQKATGTEPIEVSHPADREPSSPSVVFHGPVVSGGDLLETRSAKQGEGVIMLKGNKTEPPKGAQSFDVCHQCGKDLTHLPKTPRFCPYCREQLLA